jgi:cation/acetate symporter
VVRIAAFAIGAVAILLAIPTTPEHCLLVALAFAVVASANLPALLYNLFWKRFNTMGATFSIYGGLIMAVLLVTFSPVVSGTPTSLVPSANFDWFLLRNPGLISIPSGFLCGLVGTLISKEVHSAERYDELSVRRLPEQEPRRQWFTEHLTSPGVKCPVTGRIALLSGLRPNRRC